MVPEDIVCEYDLYFFCLLCFQAPWLSQNLPLS